MIRNVARCVPNSRKDTFVIFKKQQTAMRTISNFNITSNYSTKSNKNHRNASVYEVCKRLLSSEGEKPRRKLPQLMNFPEIVWPSLLKSMRNFILSTFIIKPYMDGDFSIPQFVKGSKKAVEVYNMWCLTNCRKEI
uniref:Uncharacterized protein n=1 Tax=Photinus pyralis TaxID=7054 RepID=A0A1Y1K2U6_PHOPY